MNVPRWSMLAGLLITGGALAWFAKIIVIVATNGRIIDTSAAAVLYLLGLALLIIGSTELGLWLARRGGARVRMIAVACSPLALLATFLLVDNIAKPLVGTSGPAYLPDEAGIAATAVLALGLGLWLFTLARQAHDAVGSRSVVSAW